MSRFSGVGYTLRPSGSTASALGTVLGAIFVIALVCACVGFGPWLFMLAWNYAVPVFWPAAPHITFWVSFVMLFVIGVLGRALFEQRSS